jgi:hypothetical protein
MYSFMYVPVCQQLPGTCKISAYIVNNFYILALYINCYGITKC